MSTTAHLEQVAALTSVAKFFRVMEKENAPLSLFMQTVDDPVKRRNLAVFLAAGCPVYDQDFKPSTSQKRACEIMGKNFLGIEETQKHFDFIFSNRQLAYMDEVPFSEEVLCECKKTHILVAYAPMSIAAICAKTASVKLPAKQHMFHKHDWDDDDDEKRNSVCALEWYLVRKTPVPRSAGKTWETQQKLLGLNDETPEAGVMVYTIIGHFLNTGERLFEKKFVRTRTFGSEGYRVNIGFPVEGLHVGHWDGVDAGWDIALPSARKQSFSTP